ncbi:TPA: hypothetical protein OUL20_002788 [Clostridioides difficile]|uniref:hypothetical protein n=1 Tax=Clostridioides difficile TaxID=1496 RepID=UPI00038CAE03|nr:hypothetical protein [Clostridioides difficile]EQH19688.1 hypothetical protein QKY_3280 [Clostridioides difficile DA00211]MBH7439349.1 hypothetical protein [Clostridioides difficile]MBS1276060.1 hypothetical protein [Clostridioides difficile]MDB0498808.1 hypothetical protein [Clostridioides difficile]PBF33839.1 hypothetical protein BGU50_03980 [Clostridioides difficile]
MKFEKGKTYKFDKEKFIACNGIEHYKRCEELWVDDIEGVEFTVEKTFDDGYVCYPNEFQCNFGMVC